MWHVIYIVQLQQVLPRFYPLQPVSFEVNDNISFANRINVVGRPVNAVRSERIQVFARLSPNVIEHFHYHSSQEILGLKEIVTKSQLNMEEKKQIIDVFCDLLT